MKQNAEHQALLRQYLSKIDEFIVAELVTSLEKLGVLPFLAKGEKFRANDMVSRFRLNPEYFSEACEFLSERGIFRKTSAGEFELAVNYWYLKWFTNFLLAYNDVFRSFAELMDGSKLYGKDITRNGLYLMDTAAFSRGSIPYICSRFKELGIKTFLDVGCGRGELMFALQKFMPNIRGIGIEVDELTAKSVEAAIKESSADGFLHVVHADGREPRAFKDRVPNSIQAILALAVFHEFRRENKINSILREYKACFPDARLFVVELDAPSWDILSQEPASSERELASFYKITHVFSNQGLPQTKDEWVRTFASAGWHTATIKEVPRRLIVYECT